MSEHNAAFDEVPLQRPNWFVGRVLSSNDLDQQQSYVRERMRRHNRLLHGWGVATGLEVAAANDGAALSVTPGFALDAAGNEILVSDLTVVDVAAAGLAPGVSYWLAVRWDECPAGAVPAPWPGEPDLAADWEEDFELQLLDERPEEAPATISRSATPWLALATVVWDADRGLTLDPSVRRLLQPPAQP